MNASPLAIDIVASVTMNGGMRSSVDEYSVDRRRPAAQMRDRRQAAQRQADDPGRLAAGQSRISRAETTADSATRLPTDRSMPPAMMTIVMPIAMIAMIAI